MKKVTWSGSEAFLGPAPRGKWPVSSQVHTCSQPDTVLEYTVHQTGIQYTLDL